MSNVSVLDGVLCVEGETWSEEEAWDRQAVSFSRLLL